MTHHLLLAAQSGWGKSFFAQGWIESNVPEFDRTVILDYKDEFRGLVKEGLASHLLVGPREKHLTTEQWGDVIESNDRLVLARHSINADEWRECCDRIVSALRSRSGTGLVAVDEAHFVTPEGGSIPTALKGLATTGRGEGMASVWITQRLTEMSETIIAQCGAKILGGFGSDRDLKKLSGYVEYPEEVHNPQYGTVRGLPPELEASDGPHSVRKFEEGGDTVGSEWIYSDESGEQRRLDTRGMAMKSTHYGAQGKNLEMPEFDQ